MQSGVCGNAVLFMGQRCAVHVAMQRSALGGLVCNLTHVAHLRRFKESLPIESYGVINALSILLGQVRNLPSQRITTEDNAQYWGGQVCDLPHVARLRRLEKSLPIAPRGRINDLNILFRQAKNLPSPSALLFGFFP